MEPHATGNATITVPAEKLERSSASAAEGQSGRTPSSSSGWRPGDAPPSRQPGGEPLRRHPEMPARRDSPDRIDGFARFGLIRHNRNENAADGYDSYCIFSRIALDYAI